MSDVLEAFGIDPSDPDVLAEQEDFDVFADLILALVQRRKKLGLTQSDVAKAMGTKQSAVSAIESSTANPTRRRLQRYARAVGARLDLGAAHPSKTNPGWDVVSSFSPVALESTTESGVSKVRRPLESRDWEVLHVA